MEESRRIKMTKKCLKQALLELLSDKHKGKITISELCDSADVNRSTFYAYYNDLDELLTEIEDDILEQIPIAIHETENHKELVAAVTKLFEYIKSDNTFRIILFSANNEKFTQKLTDYLYNYYSDLKQDASPSDRFALIYRISGTIGAVKCWIEEDFPLPPSEFAELTLQMTLK